MKRQRKFRAWDNQEKCWYKPTHEAYKGNLWELFLGFSGDLCAHSIENGNSIMIHESKFPNRYEIVEFVGHKNKKGIEIYEGDYDIDGNCVTWCENCNGWEFAAIDIPTKDIYIPCHKCEGNFFFEDAINDFEISGNIYEK
jgi:hypothetical protein